MKATNKQTILIVDDEETFRKTYKDVLSDRYIIKQASSAEEAEKLIKEEKPDLILLDLILPKKSGQEFLMELQQNPETQSIPVIILSVLGLEQEGQIQQVLDLGAKDYTIKGLYKPSEIREKIVALLESW